MERYWVLSASLMTVAAAANLLAVAVVLLGARDRRIAKSFAPMALCMAFWNILIAVESVPGLTVTYGALIHVLRYSVFVLPALVFQNAVVWSATDGKWIGILLKCSYAAAASLCIAHAGGFLVAGFLIRPWGAVANPGPLYPFHVLNTAIWVIFGFVVAIRALSHKDARIRLRTQYWLLCAAVFFPLGMTNFLTNYGLDILPLGFMGNVFTVLVLAYAAVRHRLMDIDTFLIRMSAAIFAGLVVMMPIVGTLLWARETPAAAGGVLATAGFLSALGLSILVFLRLREFFEGEGGSSLLGARRLAREAVRQFSQDVVKLERYGDLGRQLVATLMENLGVRGAAVYLRTEGGEGAERAAVAGDIWAPGRIDEADVLGRYGGGERNELRGKEVIGEGDWELCVPVQTQEEVKGLIALASKSNGAEIDESERVLLCVLAAQIAIAVKNGEYVSEIQRQEELIRELHERLAAENLALREELRAVSPFQEIIGSSEALQRVLFLVQQVARTDASVLITGETGTGKELLARAIHDLSDRRDGPLICVNCPAIPEGLAESELFGHERGAFTGAIQARPGKFEQAEGGSLFFDELGDLSLGIQVKLLRVLQEREIQRVGGVRIKRLGVRIISATNRDLREAIRERQFREDLYYRLATVEVRAPTLRERSEDIAMLATFFLDRGAKKFQRDVRGFTSDALSALRRYSWPGNIRELENVVERALLLCRGQVVKVEHLTGLEMGRIGTSSLGETMKNEKARRVFDALRITGGNQAAAARLLGMSRSNLNRLIKTLGVKFTRSIQ